MFDQSAYIVATTQVRDFKFAGAPVKGCSWQLMVALIVSTIWLVLSWTVTNVHNERLLNVKHRTN